MAFFTTYSMTELRAILDKSLLEDSSLMIMIDCNIPKLTLRINDSRQMIFYGIGLDKRQGFTLHIDIDRNSNKGKKLKEALTDNNFLSGFKSFEDKKSIVYLKDFRQEVGLLEKTIDNLLNTFDKSGSGQSYQLRVNRTDGNYRVE